MGGFGGGHLVQQFFVSQVQLETTITGEELKHMQVLRLQVGEEILLSDGKKLYRGEVLSLGKQEAKVKVLAEMPSSEPPYHIPLYQGLPKGDKINFIVQKAVELGVSRIVPVQTERSVVKWDNKSAKNKIERLNRVALEAAKQSHRVVKPEVSMPLLWSEFVAKWHDFSGLKLVFWEQGYDHLNKAFLESPEKIGIVIGPEGGLSKEEALALESPLYTLGPRILRTETASIAALSMLMFALELKGEKHF